jgi:hypothetical protein
VIPAASILDYLFRLVPDSTKGASRLGTVRLKANDRPVEPLTQTLFVAALTAANREQRRHPRSIVGQRLMIGGFSFDARSTVCSHKTIGRRALLARLFCHYWFRFTWITSQLPERGYCQSSGFLGFLRRAGSSRLLLWWSSLQ